MTEECVAACSKCLGALTASDSTFVDFGPVARVDSEPVLDARQLSPAFGQRRRQGLDILKGKIFFKKTFATLQTASMPYEYNLGASGRVHGSSSGPYHQSPFSCSPSTSLVHQEFQTPIASQLHL